MRFFILAHPDDDHTAPVSWALRQAGHEVNCWSSLGWQAREQGSIAFNEDVRISLGDCEIRPGDVVWNRRPNYPVYNPNVSEEDRKFAEGEYRLLSRSIMHLLDTYPIRFINKYSVSRFIGSKAVQLQVARACDLSFPETLMSNKPEDIRAFLRATGSRNVCKAFLPHVWQKTDSEGCAINETFEIAFDSLPADEVLTYAPAIFQRRVEKAADVRVVVFGEVVYSYLIETLEGSLDWRQDAWQQKASVRPIPTPPEIREQVKAFSKMAGLAFGSADFVIDESGRWWFIEMNEAGQFLWLEVLNPEIKILQFFLSYLTQDIGAGEEQIKAKASHFPSLLDFENSDEKLMERYSGRAERYLSYEL